jgi:hypothetical protein
MKYGDKKTIVKITGMVIAKDIEDKEIVLPMFWLVTIVACFKDRYILDTGSKDLLHAKIEDIDNNSEPV